METTGIRVVIADDHAVVREGLTAILSGQPDIILVGAATNGSEALTLVQEAGPDVVLLDLVMPTMDGLAALHAIKQARPATRIVILTSFADDERIFAAIKSGAMGYLLKDSSRGQLLEAVRSAAQGHAYLHPSVAMKVMHEFSGTAEHAAAAPSAVSAAADPPAEALTERELETLRLLARGMSNHDIAIALNIHERTVAKYVGHILEKLHLANRTQAALYALRRGIERLPPADE
jgi:NarL family two-component system response regulator LiaR